MGLLGGLSFWVRLCGLVRASLLVCLVAPWGLVGGVSFGCAGLSGVKWRHVGIGSYRDVVSFRGVVGGDSQDGGGRACRWDWFVERSSHVVAWAAATRTKVVAELAGGIGLYCLLSWRGRQGLSVGDCPIGMSCCVVACAPATPIKVVAKLAGIGDNQDRLRSR